MSVVSNASPLIGLARIGELELLQQLYGELVIPEAVEIEAKSKGYIDSVKGYLNSLRDVAGFYVSERLYMRVIQDADEAT